MSYFNKGFFKVSSDFCTNISAGWFGAIVIVPIISGYLDVIKYIIYFVAAFLMAKFFEERSEKYEHS